MTPPVRYSFVTKFWLAAPCDAIWSVLSDLGDWGKWWKAVHKMSVSGEGIDRVVTFDVGHLGYYLVFSLQELETELHREIRFVSKGDLEGIGKFILTDMLSYTQITFYWNVQTNKPWMNILAPMLSPFFEFGHDIVIREFVYGLADELKSRVMEIKSKGEKVS